MGLGRMQGKSVLVTGAAFGIGRATAVTFADEGARLIFSHGEVERTHLWCPGGATDPQFQALTRDLVGYLDRSRGYRNIV